DKVDKVEVIEIVILVLGALVGTLEEIEVVLIVEAVIRDDVTKILRVITSRFFTIRESLTL
ncbi:MAG: hypothetical protein ACJA1H_001480, partial [Glaciecola sp.]